MVRSAVLGSGHYLPPPVERLGVARPIEVAPEGTSALGVRASQAALRAAGLTPPDIDFIVFATINPDVTFPGAACYLQHALGCGTIGSLDVRAQCSGFVYGLSIADQFVRCGVYRRVLVVGAELHSVWVDYGPRGADLARLFGDGAGAVVLGPENDGRGILAAALHADGSGHDLFWCEYPASRQHPLRVTAENLRAGGHYPAMDEAAVRRAGAAMLPQVVREVAASASAAVGDIGALMVGHVFPDVAAGAAADLGVDPARVVNPSQVHGHLGAAALPVALSTEMAAGRIGAGSLVCLAAAGAGLTSAAALIRL